MALHHTKKKTAADKFSGGFLYTVPVLLHIDICVLGM